MHVVPEAAEHAENPSTPLFAALRTDASPSVADTPYAIAINATITRPIQYPEKLPAVRPDRMLSDAPPSFDAVTTSLTWPEFIDVNTLTASGMIAPASVPHEMIVASFHHSPCSSVKLPWPISRYDTRKVKPIDTIDVSHTSTVSGCSKFILSAFRYWLRATTALIRYDPTDARIITMRIAKIHTSRTACSCSPNGVTVGIATRLNVISATPVTP